MLFGYVTPVYANFVTHTSVPRGAGADSRDVLNDAGHELGSAASSRDGLVPGVDQQRRTGFADESGAARPATRMLPPSSPEPCTGGELRQHGDDGVGHKRQRKAAPAQL